MKKITCLAVCFVFLFSACLQAASVVDLDGHIKYYASSAVFSPDSKKIAVADDSTYIWDIVSGKILRTLEGGLCTLGETMTGGWSPDGTKIATTGGIWDVESGKKLHSLSGTWSPDGTKIVTAGRQITQIWDAESGNNLHTLEGTLGTWSPDGTKIVTAGQDNISRIWDVKSGMVLQKLDLISGWGADLANEWGKFVFSPDGTKIAVINYHSAPIILICDINTGKLLRTFRGRVIDGWQACGNMYSFGNVVFSPDSKKIVVMALINPCDGATDLRTMSVRERMKYSRTRREFSRLTQLAEREASNARIWNIDTGNELVLRGYGRDNELIATDFSPDGKRIISTRGNAVRTWDASTGRLLQTSGKKLKLQEGNIIARSPDGKRVAVVYYNVDYSNTIRIWTLP